MITKTGLVTTPDFIESNGTSTLTIGSGITGNNGIYSGFASSTGLTTNGSLTPTDNLIIYGSFTTGTNITSSQFPMCPTARTICLRIESSKLYLCVSGNGGSSWNLNYSTASTASIAVSTKYYYKIIGNGTNIKLYVNDILVQTVTLSGTYVTGNLGYGYHLPTSGSQFLGSIDIRDCGLVKNNVEIWNGYETLLGSNTAKIGKNFVSGRTINEI